MNKKLFLIIGSIAFLAVSGFIVFQIVKSEKNKVVKDQAEAPVGKKENSENLLTVPVENVKSKSDAQKTLNDADALMSSMDDDTAIE